MFSFRYFYGKIQQKRAELDSIVLYHPTTDGAEFKQLAAVYIVLKDKKSLSNNKTVRKNLKKKKLYY